MGMSNMQVQQSTQQGAGKGAAPGMPQLPQPNSNGVSMGQMPLPMPRQMQNQGFQGQQPSFGQPSRYSNTMPSWDNASIMPSRQAGGVGKIGKGGSGFERAQTSFPKQPTSVDAAQPAAAGGITGTMSALLDSMGQ